MGKNTTRLPAGHESPRRGIDDGDLPCGVSGEWATISFSETFAAWLGLVPREFSSGGKQRLGRISKRGDRYFRYLLVHGARAVAAVIERHKDNMPWLCRLLNKKAYNVAVVAQANKTARILWSMLVHHTEYRTLSAV
nr:transposase [Yersinia enterocolitica]